MGELSPPPATVLPVVFVDGDRNVDLGTVTVQPSLGVKKLQAVVADRVGVAPHQISPFLARHRRARRVPLEDGADLAAAVAREGSGCYVLATLRRSRRDKKAAAASAAAATAPLPLPAEKTILKRLPPTDLASLVAAAAPPAMFGGGWDYEAQRQRDWYLASAAAAPDPYHLPPLVPEMEDPPLWSPQRPACPECEAAAAAMRQPPFHWCVRDAVVTAGFRSHVGPIERPVKKSPSPPPLPGLLGMPVY